MELMELSDDALVSVLQFIELEDLFTCRLVCKRLGGLALHWDTWRHRVIKFMFMEVAAPLASALLHLAPCLRSAAVNEQDIMALTRSKCAVAHLTLFGPRKDKDPLFAAYYAKAVRNQEALGRLRGLRLLFTDYDYDEDASKELANAVVACSALEELIVGGKTPFTPHLVTQEPTKPSLKKLWYPVNNEDLAFVNALLAWHGATLDEVILDGENVCYSDAMPRLLGAMPRLTTLSCPAMPGLQAVAACTMLNDLSLRVPTSEPTIVQDAVKLLHQAKLLNKVQISINALHGVAEKLIKALGSSGSRLVVEQLELKVSRYEEMWALPPMLPSLPALRSLKVSEISDAVYTPEGYAGYPSDALDKLLQAITPETAPALRTLEVSLYNFHCAHAWIHRAAVCKALTMNPSLRILLRGGCDFHCDECSKCKLRHCHDGVRIASALTVWKICLLSHDSGCTAPRNYYAKGQWMKIDPNFEEPHDLYDYSYDPALLYW